MKTRTRALVAAVLTLFACSAEPPAETVFDDQLETLDRARDVQITVDEHAAEMRKRIDDADEDTPDR